MKPINLFYLAEPKYGGWVSFTAHLHAALSAQGYAPTIYKLGKRTEGFARSYGLGLSYFNVSAADASLMTASAPTILTAVGPKFSDAAARLLSRGAVLVLHDPTELNKGMISALAQSRRDVVVIRHANIPHVEKHGVRARFIPHPYCRSARTPAPRKTVNAVALSRLDWDKHTLLIAEANARLPQAQRVNIYGAENSMYTHHKLDPVVPNWRADYRGRFPSTPGAAVRIAETARYVVDMSVIAGDGDGTQYTFLEAWDAGAALVVNSRWITTGKGAIVPGKTALAADNARTLADILQQEPSADLVRAGYAMLAQHAPQKVVREYAAFFS